MLVYFTPASNNINPYINNLLKHLDSKGVSIFQGSIWKALLNNKIKVFHFNWFLNTPKRPIKAVLSYAKKIIILVLIWIFRKRLIWTRHNILPHEPAIKPLAIFSRFLLERVAWRIIEHQNRYIKNRNKSVFIPHGLYQVDKIDTKPVIKFKNKESIRLLHFGLIRNYKQIPKLLSAFKAFDNTDFELVIVGKCDSDILRNEILSTWKNEKNIQVHLNFIKDEELNYLLSEADCTIQMHTSKNLNSGALILALSAGLFVVTTDIAMCEQFEESQVYKIYDNKGSETIEKQLNGAFTFISKNINNLRLQRKSRMHHFNSQHSWDVVGNSVFELYQNAENN